MSAEKHVHRYLPSYGCGWRCRCGDVFVSCICGKSCTKESTAAAEKRARKITLRRRVRA